MKTLHDILGKKKFAKKWSKYMIDERLLEKQYMKSSLQYQ